MSFRLLFYVGRILPFLLFPPLLLGYFIFPQEPILRQAGKIALVASGILAALGALLGLIGVTVGLRLKCPFCGSRGWVGGDRRRGFHLSCENCGTVRGRGFLGLRLIREPEDAE